VVDGIELVDQSCVQDVFVEGIGRITKIAGNCLRYTFYATRDHGDGDVEYVVVAQLVWPLDLLMIAHEQSDAVIRGLPFMALNAPSAVPH
jgi:hypothetical protein